MDIVPKQQEAKMKGSFKYIAGKHISGAIATKIPNGMARIHLMFCDNTYLEIFSDCPPILPDTWKPSNTLLGGKEHRRNIAATVLNTDAWRFYGCSHPCINPGTSLGVPHASAGPSKEFASQSGISVDRHYCALSRNAARDGHLSAHSCRVFADPLRKG